MLFDHIGRNKKVANYGKAKQANEKAGFKHRGIFMYYEPDSDGSHITPIKREGKNKSIIEPDRFIPLYVVPEKELCTSEYGIKLKADILPARNEEEKDVIIIAESVLNNERKAAIILTYLAYKIVCREYDSDWDNLTAAKIRTLKECEQLYTFFKKRNILKVIHKGTDPLRNSDKRALIDWKQSEAHIIGDSGYKDQDEEGYQDDGYEETTETKTHRRRPITI